MKIYTESGGYYWLDKVIPEAEDIVINEDFPARDAMIVKLRGRGLTYEQIGQLFLNKATGLPLSRARISQICMKKLPLTVPQRSYRGKRERIDLPPRWAKCKACHRAFTYTTKYPYRCPHCGGFRWKVKRSPRGSKKAA